MGQDIATLIGFVTILVWIDIMVNYAPAKNPSRRAKFSWKIFPLLMYTFLGASGLCQDYVEVTWITWILGAFYIYGWIFIFRLTFNLNTVDDNAPKTNEANPAMRGGVIDFLADPNGFADLRFGETLEDVQASHETKFIDGKNGKALYAILVPDAHGSLFFIGSVFVKGIFWNNKLGAILIPFDKELFTERLEGLRKILGEYDGSDPGVYTWKGPFSIIMLGKMGGKGMLSIFMREKN